MRGRGATLARRSSLALLLVAALAVSGAAGADKEGAPRPEWSVGDWWEFAEGSNSWRLTVIARESGHYVLARSARGTTVADGRGRTTHHADLDGWITKTIAADGKITAGRDKLQWVKFPMAVGNRWFFSAYSTLVSGPSGQLRMIDFSGFVEGWETITIGNRSVRTLKMRYTQKVRDLGPGDDITGWYAPDAKRLVRLRTPYAGGWTLDVTAFEIRSDTTIVAGAPTPTVDPPPRPSTITPPPRVAEPPARIAEPPAPPRQPAKPPVVVLNYPASDLKIERDQIVVVGLVTAEAGIAMVQLTVNGSVVTPGDIKTGGRGVPIRATVRLLPGDNVIEVTVTDAAGSMAQVVRTVTRTGAADTSAHAGARSANRFAVVIGVGRYENEQIPRLRYSVADAEAIYRTLIGVAGFKKEHVLLLTDTTERKPTLRNIKWALGTFLTRQARKDDMVLIFFAGHGAPEVDPRGLERDGLAKYLIPIDADPDDLYSTALPMDELHTIFARLESERIVALLDACYSGAAGGRTFTAKRTRSGGIDDVFLDRLTRSKGRVVITASRSTEVSIELPELGHGLFTYHLLQALTGAADVNRDGIVSLQELYEYVEGRVSEKSRSVGANQHPVMRGEMEGVLPLTWVRAR